MPALPAALLTLLLSAAAPAPPAARPAPPPPDTLRPLSPDRLLRYTYANDFWFRTDY